MGVLPAGFVENPEVVVDHDCPFAGFLCRGFALKITPVRVDEGKPCRLFCILFQEGEESLKEFKVFFLQSIVSGQWLFLRRRAAGLPPSNPL